MNKHRSLSEKQAECEALLRSTNRPNIEKLIAHITKMGYFIAPGSKDHHRFKGGLVSHSLELYYKAMELRERYIKFGTDPATMPKESVIIAALMHDLCKADCLRYNPDTRKVYSIHHGKGHSARSVRQVGYSGFELTPQEKDAILWHMGGRRIERDPAKRREHFLRNPLTSIINRADGSSIGESKQRHHGNRREE